MTLQPRRPTWQVVHIVDRTGHTCRECSEDLTSGGPPFPAGAVVVVESGAAYRVADPRATCKAL